MQLSQLLLSPSLLHRVEPVTPWSSLLQLGVARYNTRLDTLRHYGLAAHLYLDTQWNTRPPAGCRLMEQSDGNPRNFMEPGPLMIPFPPLISISQGGPEGHPLYLRLPAHDNNGSKSGQFFRV